MRFAALLLLLPTFACTASRASGPVVASSADGLRAVGATLRQPADDPSRTLTPGECAALGSWIAETCEVGARSSVATGWCNDVLARTTAPAWARDCASHVPPGELACFLQSTSAPAMMTCDSEIDG